MKKVNWEELAKNLQEALAKEMKENEILASEIERLNNELEDRSDNGFNQFLDRRKQDAIIAYLENRLYQEMFKNQKADEEIPF